MNPVALAKAIIWAIIFYFLIAWLVPSFLTTYSIIAGGLIGIGILIYAAGRFMK